MKKAEALSSGNVDLTKITTEKMIILITIVVFILIGLAIRKHSKNKLIKKTEQQRQARLQKEREENEQQAKIKKQYQIERDRQAELKRIEDEVREQKRQALYNNPKKQRTLSILQNIVNGGLRPLDSVTKGNLFDFVCSGKCESFIRKIVNGENITYTYAFSMDGIHMMIPTAHKHLDYSTGKIIKCIVICFPINGFTMKYIIPANEEEIALQTLIDNQNQIEIDRQEALQREQRQAERQRLQEEKDKLTKQKKLTEQKRQASEKEKPSSLSEIAKYIGEYKNGKIHGKGTLIYSDGRKYEGNFVNGAMEGYGVLSYSDGEIYEGNFKKDKYNGNGVLTKANGKIIEGEFTNGDFLTDKVGEDVINYLHFHRDMKPFYLFIDTETTALFDDEKFEEYFDEHRRIDEAGKLRKILNTPRLVKLSYLVQDKNGMQVAANDFIIRPTELIPLSVSKIHGITTEIAKRDGVAIKPVLQHFSNLISYTKIIIGHNIFFDQEIIVNEFLRNGIQDSFTDKRLIDTMGASADFCSIRGKNGHKYPKYPKLSELHYKLFQKEFNGAHDSSVDVAITAKCYWELKKLGIL